MTKAMVVPTVTVRIKMKENSNTQYLLRTAFCLRLRSLYINYRLIPIKISGIAAKQTVRKIRSAIKRRKKAYTL